MTRTDGNLTPAASAGTLEFPGARARAIETEGMRPL